MDPEVKKYFIKILNSFSLGLIWLISASTFAFYFGLGIVHNGLQVHNIVFYTIALLSFLLLLRYYYNTWKNKPQEL
ncbi:MAG: hypothetical protein C4329_07040 [Chitinophagaceae bacterium]